jgi:hypothetical protein
VFLISLESCSSPWSDSGDQGLVLGELTRGLCSSPTVQAKTGLTGFPNRSDRFRPVGCRGRSLSKEVFAALWLRLFRYGKAFEVFGVFGEFLDRIGLTGLPNRSDRFPLPA